MVSATEGKKRRVLGSSSPATKTAGTLVSVG